MDCKTKYPLLLAHGLAMPDSGVSYPCWGRIPALLRAHGATVFLGGQDAYGSIETGASQLADAAQAAMEQENSPRINLIAHSKGGLEVRYLISTLGLGDKVASLTMLSTPNRGARGAEVMLKWPTTKVWCFQNDRYWKKHGDKKPESFRTAEQMTASYLEQFNRDNPDADGVYYQSWGARLNGAKTDKMMAFSEKIFFSNDADTDGLVTPASAAWGHYCGTLEGVSHLMLVDVYGRDLPGFDPCAFYLQLVRGLVELGF